jgi:uncharacterized OsmC-like protein
VRGVRSADNLTANVEGDIEDVGGVMRITRIRLRYRFRILAGTREKLERLLDSYAEQCPAYQSVKGCIECTWEAEMEETT